MKTKPVPVDWPRNVHRSLSIALLLVLLHLAAPPGTAQTPAPYTAAGWLMDLPAPGIWFTNASGQLGLRGNVHTLRMECADPRMNGRRIAFADGAYQADGGAIVYGTAYQEVGTWNLADPRNPTFTPAGGLWEISYRGTMAADNSMQLHVVGRGSGGAIEGWRLEEEATRTAGAPFDPQIAFQYTGTLQPPPVDTTEVLNDFDTGNLAKWTVYSDGTIGITNKQMRVRGYYQIHTTTLEDSYVVGGRNGSWAILDGFTREWRADLIELNTNAANYAILLAGNGYIGDLFAIYVGRDSVFLKKWSPSSGVSIFSCDKVSLRNTNLVLSLALTRLNANLLVTGRVLDKANPGAVLYQHSVLDTPKPDPTLNTASFEAFSGMRVVNLRPDLGGTPAKFFTVAALGVFQYTDGTKPPVIATFDNLELRTFEVPMINVERAVRLRWPVSATIRYSVEGAPTPQGPWIPVQDAATPDMRELSLPAGDPMQYFRLRQAP